jgi:FkbM family methyltransferase
LVEEFKTIKRVIAIEADPKNFSILKANFDLWRGSLSKEIEWVSINAVAACGATEKMVRTNSLADITGKNSASGTFRFNSIPKNKNESNLENVVAIVDLFKETEEHEKIIVKIDIEGGEENLFKRNTDWLKRCFFLTTEIHDGIHPVMVNSSKSLIKSIANLNYAFDASEDVLHLYNRDLLF